MKPKTGEFVIMTSVVIGFLAYVSLLYGMDIVTYDIIWRVLIAILLTVIATKGVK